MLVLPSSLRNIKCWGLNNTNQEIRLRKQNRKQIIVEDILSGRVKFTSVIQMMRSEFFFQRKKKETQSKKWTSKALKNKESRLKRVSSSRNKNILPFTFLSRVESLKLG